ncbi:MAG: hypothetical protein E7502_02805 [Ruminococcus sp.]|nr:hypothetical protein [Ruminococcus sp.]
MNNHELLQKKLRQQKHHRFLQTLTGVRVLCEECTDAHLAEILQKLPDVAFYNNDKLPDDKIPCHTEKAELYHWIIQKMQINEGLHCYLLHDGMWAALLIENSLAAVQSLWESTNGFALLNVEQNILCEVCSDSRDEQHYLFDVYHLGNETMKLTSISEFLNRDDSFLVKLRCENRFDTVAYAEIRNALTQNATIWKTKGSVPVEEVAALVSLIDQLAGGSRFFDEETAIQVEDACIEIEEIISDLIEQSDI